MLNATKSTVLKGITRLKFQNVMASILREIGCALWQLAIKKAFGESASFVFQSYLRIEEASITLVRTTMKNQMFSKGYFICELKSFPNNTSLARIFTDLCGLLSSTKYFSLSSLAHRSEYTELKSKVWGWKKHPVQLNKHPKQV